MKEERIMDCHCNANPSIECTVKECKHHFGAKNFCSLEHVQIGTHEADPTVKECVDCMSFARK